MAKNLLKDFVIAVTGDFGPDRTEAKIRHLIEENGGAYAANIDSEVTHLVCSLAGYKKKVPKVQAAQKIKSIKIVTFDWLEDCLLDKKQLKAKAYLVSVVVKGRAERKSRKKQARKENLLSGIKQFEEGCEAFRNEMHSDGYHIYHDPTGFRYDIILARADIGANTNRRVQLKLYESNRVPKRYACFATIFATRGVPAIKVVAPTPSSWETAFGMFKKFFKTKTKTEWENRISAAEAGRQDTTATGDAGEEPALKYRVPPDDPMTRNPDGEIHW